MILLQNLYSETTLFHIHWVVSEWSLLKLDGGGGVMMDIKAVTEKKDV